MQETLSPDQQLYALRQKLLGTYTEIGARARGMILRGEVVNNPLLTQEKEETRYSIAATGLLNGLADAFLETASSQLTTVEPDIRITPSGFRHIAFREVVFNEHGRQATGIDADAAKKYHKALQKGFSEPGKPIQLELVKVLPAIDREQDSVSVVGAFLPVGDTRILDVRNTISTSVQEAGLDLQGRLGDIRVLFSTLGRLPHPPRIEDGKIPLLEVVEAINKQIPQNCTSTIDKIDMVSTTPISYVWIDKHVYMIPSISLTGQNNNSEPRFVTASHRRIMKELED